MPYRDAEGHFISREEAERLGLIPAGEVPTEGGEEEEVVAEPRHWAAEERGQPQAIFVDTGRGEAVQVQAGIPFALTLERLADEAHYGGYYRVFLNGSEVINPEDSPETIEPGMRIAITSYDKVG